MIRHFSALLQFITILFSWKYFDQVCTREEMELLAANSKESDKLYNYLMEKSNSKEWKKAIETRDRLVRTDRLG